MNFQLTSKYKPTGDPVRLDIHFLKECRYGQTLAVGCELRERSALFEIAGDGGPAAVRASVEWK